MTNAVRDKCGARTGIGSDREAALDGDQGSSLCRDVADNRGYGEIISGLASRAEGAASAKAQKASAWCARTSVKASPCTEGSEGDRKGYVGSYPRTRLCRTS